MNKDADRLLDQLMASARPSQEEVPAAMPVGFATRVVRHAFARRDDHEVTDFFPMVRMALGVAVFALCVSILVNLPILREATVGLTEFAIQHQLTSQVLSAR